MAQKKTVFVNVFLDLYQEDVFYFSKSKNTRTEALKSVRVGLEDRYVDTIRIELELTESYNERMKKSDPNLEE